MKIYTLFTRAENDAHRPQEEIGEDLEGVFSSMEKIIEYLDPERLEWLDRYLSSSEINMLSRRGQEVIIDGVIVRVLSDALDGG